MAYFRKIRFRTEARTSTALDYPMLIALLNAAQGSAAAPVRDGSASAVEGNVIDLIEGGPAWRRAILGQGGSFNRDVAERECDPPPA
ncbi:MAG TPA: hypothetical protein VI381_01815 [Allosphingosinicella sp.]